MVGGGRDRRRCLDPDFLYIGGMWSGRKWKLTSLHQIRDDINQENELRKAAGKHSGGKH